MRTEEKLFVQIFEREKSILEQVKKQTELFDQHLASKCVLDGISPPPWLLSLSFASLPLNPNGLKKEELISGLLLPRSQPPRFYPSVHHPHSENPFVPTSSTKENPFVPAANEVQPNFLEREVHDVNKVSDSVGRLSVPTQYPTADTPSALNHALDSQDPGYCTEHSRSLVRIERSRSRQRALEIRSSARSVNPHENAENNDPGSCQNNIYSTEGELKVVESWRKEGSSNHDNVRTQSGGQCQLSSPMNELPSKNKSSDIVKKDVVREAHSSDEKHATEEMLQGLDNNTVYAFEVPSSNLPVEEEAISSDEKHASDEMLQGMDNNTIHAFEVLSCNLPVEEGEHTLGGRDRSENTALSFMHEHLEANPLSSLTKLSNGSFQGSLSGQAKVWEPTGISGLQISGESQVFSPRVSDSFYMGKLVTESNMQLTNSDSGVYQNPPDHPVATPLPMDPIAADKNGPELEKFVLETNDEEPSARVNGTSFHQLSSSNIALEHAVTNKQFEATSSNFSSDQVSSFTSHVTFMFPTENALFIQGSSEVNISPLRKFWEPMPSKSLSSERRASSIPELPSIDEETENMDDDIVITSLKKAIKTVERKPLADITESADHPASICDEDEVIDDRYSLASVCTEFSVASSTRNTKTGNQTSSRRRYDYAAGSKRKLKQQQPRVPLGVKRNDGSLQNRLFSKPPKLSRKNEPRKVSAGLLEKEPKHNNIVSNVTSFVPLVQQQKQMAAAAAVIGKRDIKVKSLEAAEAAKRLAEKKENDRRLKKEALKLERARIEEQNLRQLEMEKGRKEEEQKKKEAEMATKKRQREEEQKKERERKRKRIEDTRRQNMEQRDKMNNGYKEEAKCCGEAPDVKASKLKEKSGEEERTEKETRTKNPSIDHATYDTRSSNSGDISKAVMKSQICEGKETNYSLDSNIIPERSYEISPYKFSDDEDEEDEDDDDKPNTKFIPSWSRRSGITFTILSQQAKLDPATIFPLESFVSKDQVVLPRKLRLL